jgi:hypothetical protein
VSSSTRWWREAAAWAAGAGDAPTARATEWYRLADGSLGVDDAPVPFRERFRQLLADCAITAPGRPGAVVRCGVRTAADPPVVLVRYDDPEPLDPVPFVIQVLGERGYAERPSPIPPWRLVTGPDTGDDVGARDALLLAHPDTRWQGLAANVAIHRVLRLQRHVACFHAASVGVRGAGVLLFGGKGSGKTTLALTLAARGHQVLGDEIAAVRLATAELVALRRAVSVRAGPLGAGVAAALARAGGAPELFPDGTERRRVPIGRLFPASATGDTLPLRAALFLRGIGATARAEPFRPGPEAARLLSPLGSTLWDVAPAARLVRLLALLGRVRCLFLDAGPPDATADVVESIAEG